jgi:CRP/FNR family transcriptional regulator, anaerobic regulatory protein
MLHISRMSIHHSSTSMRPKDLGQLGQRVGTRRSVKRGVALFRAGDRLKSLYTVCTGSLKSTVTSLDGREQVTGFYVTGELVGWDGIHTGRHSFDMLALEDTEVRVLPYAQLQSAASSLPALRTDLHKIMSREIVRDHEMMLLLGSMRADERLAMFLLNLAQSLRAVRGADRQFALHMTRAEIGSFLGLKLETVSRAFSRLARDGLIELNYRQVRIVSPQRLRRVLQGASAR